MQPPGYLQALALSVGLLGLAGCGDREIKGGAGADVIEVGDRPARVFAGDGADRVRGSPRADAIDGNGSDDRLDGGRGDDTIHGGRGNDTVRGEEGDDVVFGDRGANLLVGGPGRDRFVLTPVGGEDVVADFDGPGGDRVEVVEGRLSVEPDGDGVVLSLEDGSRLRLPDMAAASAYRWIELPYSWARLSRDTGFVGALAVAIVAAAAALAALAGRWRPRRRTGIDTAAGGGALRPQPSEATGDDPLVERLPHAEPRSIGLDAMRAAAILLVLASHWAGMAPWLGLPPPHGVWFLGELGVVLFFALSGFLIGRILIAQAGADPSWRNFRIFMVRRWMRTLPLYFLVLAVLLIAAPPPDRLLYGMRYATLTQNVLAPMPPTGFFAVSWSLTVEEWFYLLFGAAVFACFRLVRRPWAIWPPLALFLLAPLALRLFAPHTPEGVYRLDQIAWGAAMAQLYRNGAPLFRRPGLCLAAGLAILGATGWTAAQIPHAFLLLSTSIGCCLLIPAALRLKMDPSWMRRAIGGVSALAYPLYLLHLDIMIGVAVLLEGPGRAPAWLCIAIATVTPFALAWLSFRYFESPILRLRPRHGSAARGPVAATAVPLAASAS